MTDPIELWNLACERDGEPMPTPKLPQIESPAASRLRAQYNRVAAYWRQQRLAYALMGAGPPPPIRGGNGDEDDEDPAQ